MLFFKQIPEISAVYYALLQSGYDFYVMGKDEALAKKLRMFGTGLNGQFWRETRQNTCAVYPYWPRAALLEQAALNLVGDRLSDDYHSAVMKAENLANEERDEAFWAWVQNFPCEVNRVLQSEDFRKYLAWEFEWLAKQKEEAQEILKRTSALLSRCRDAYGLTIDGVGVLLSPIKCAYSADYHLKDGCFYYSSGALNIDSIVHETMHLAVHPMILELRDVVLASQAEWKDIDSSYYLSGDEAGKLNAFEEYATRSLSEAVLSGETPELCEFVLGML